MTVRWGVLGAGSIADVAMVPALHAASGAAVVAVAARSGERAATFAARHGIPAAYGSYADLLADPDVDAVYVALANDAHAPWTIAALRAGKHVLCEKPLALNAAEVDAMTAAAALADRLLVEASWYRWHPRVRLAERAIAAGRIGAVRHVNAGFTFAGVPDANYRMDPARGGGALYDVGCYAVSAALWAFGTPPRSVSATADVGPTGVDLTTDATVTFDGGVAEVRASIAEAGRQWLVVAGDGGEVALRDAPYTSWVGTDSTLLVAGEEIAVPAADPYRLMVEEVSAVIEGRDGWVLPLAASRLTAAVLDAAFASARTGRAVAIPAATGG